MNPVVLYRPQDMDQAELECASRHFQTFRERTRLQKDDLVIGRYGCLPFYDQYQADCDYAGAKPLNSLKQHRYLADLRNWVEDIKDLTPKTWYRLEDIDEEGPYILKGETNSRKGDWKTHCFAKDRKAADEVYWRLCSDGVVGGGQQQIYIRKFVPLYTYFTGLNDIPVTKEFRFFTAYGRAICGAFYWANYEEDMPNIPIPDEKDYKFVEEVLSRIDGRATGVVVDIAHTQDGRRIVVELNDFQQSGLSLNNPEILYSGLRHIFVEEGICT